VGYQHPDSFVRHILADDEYALSAIFDDQFQNVLGALHRVKDHIGCENIDIVQHSNTSAGVGHQVGRNIASPETGAFVIGPIMIGGDVGLDDDVGVGTQHVVNLSQQLADLSIARGGCCYGCDVVF